MARRVAVCVVGAGAAGLCAARQLAARPDVFTFRVYEQADGVGGTWVYTEDIGTDCNGLRVHSSMYENLRTNILQEIMGFPDFPFPEAKGTSYPKHDVVLKYLEDYAEHFDLKKHVSFRTVVKAVRPAGGPSSRTWAVTVYSGESRSEETQEFDAVLVCNGHYSTPFWPDVAGLESFEGAVLHSHDYRRPQDFAGQRVVLLGAAASGRDIALDLARHAREVLLCHRGAPLRSELPANVLQLSAIAEATPTGFVLEDGSAVHADAIVFCTGYRYTFPFLSPQCGVFVRGRRVRPLYKHIVNIEMPSLGFIGIPFIVLPFPLFHCQVAFFLKSLVDPSILPSTEEMYEDERRDFQKRLDLGFPPRYAHKMAQLQWDYNDELADAAGIERLHSVFRELYEVNSYQMMNFLAEYKNKCYRETYKDKVNYS
ncbi:Flavin-containing monooxygenase [Gryllus bimaculatus]|nr:Flavin-containing monooxygenase [Gryllus bimaculatus]